jgi:hypothetical protein
LGEVENLVEYSVMFQDKDSKKTGWIWDVVPELDEITAAQHVLKLSVKQAVEEDLEVVAMARANKTIFKENGMYRTIYTSQFEKVDIHAPIFDGIKNV